jgi:hypothetical protein
MSTNCTANLLILPRTHSYTKLRFLSDRNELIMLVALRPSRFLPQPRESCPKETLEILNSIPSIPSDVDIEDKNGTRIVVQNQSGRRPFKFAFFAHSNRRLQKRVDINPSERVERPDSRRPPPQLQIEGNSAIQPESLRIEPESTPDVDVEIAHSRTPEIQSNSVEESQAPEPLQVNEQLPVLQTALLRRICADCYVAPDVEIEPALSDEYNRKIKGRLETFLRGLPLRDRRVMLEYVSAATCSAPHKDQVHATILFYCLNDGQQKAILAGLKKRSLIPPHFQHRVVIQELGFCSSTISTPMNLGFMSGQVVTARILSNRTMCGVLGRAPAGGSDCTLGGLIRVGGSVYALTTAHGFLGRGSEYLSDHPLIGMPLQIWRIVPMLIFIVQDFQPIGNIHSYKFSETSNIQEPDSAAVVNTTYDQDWALVRVQPLLYRENSFEVPGSNIPMLVEGHVKTSELCHGPVMVLSSLSGVRQGYLSAGISSLIIGNSCFEVWSIALDGSLG